MNKDIYTRLLKLLEGGMDLDAACLQVVAESSFGASPGRMGFMQMKVSVRSVPSPKCIADKLRDKAAPTYNDIEAAFRACS
jgi:hypothetical protein